MYFPYLRGKQFELLALRELSNRIGTSEKISPVLEPVKRSTTALERAMEAMIVYNVNFTIIINPSVGECVLNNSTIIDVINRKLSNYANFQLGIIVSEFIDLSLIDQTLQAITSQKTLALIHVERPDNLDQLLEWAETSDIRYNLYYDTIPIRRYRGLITNETKIILADNFKSKQKNADYLLRADEFFSDEHLYFIENDDVGFSDFLTVGKEYSESGFLPYAVAIHLTYINRNDNTIRIRHFVSDSNSDNIDVPGKFGEAIVKLMEFIDQENIQTDAANEFRAHFLNGHYPGLGSLKKLSIKNHIELLLELLG